MPWRPAGPCAVPRCPGRSVRRGRCERHATEYEQQVLAPGRAAYDQTRPSASQRGYDAAWWKVRCRQLARYPDCARCHAPATEVHHIVALRDGGARLDPDNLCSLCKSCHSGITNRERRRG